MVPPQDPPAGGEADAQDAVDVALAAFDGTVESGGLKIEQQVRRKAMKVPGTAVTMPSGRRYVVHTDGSLRRMDG
jgi:hypothetical protein